MWAGICVYLCSQVTNEGGGSSVVVFDAVKVSW